MDVEMFIEQSGNRFRLTIRNVNDIFLSPIDFPTLVLD